VGRELPLNATVETSSAAANSAMVARRSRRGVSQVAWRDCSQQRAPEAPAAAAIAQPTHMPRV
jgi:hypothetical protein